VAQGDQGDLWPVLPISYIQPAQLVVDFERKGWNGSLREVSKRLACKECRERFGRRVRLPRVELVAEADGDRRLSMPSERDWKRAITRFRS
jgi:hypothetical protein